MPGEDPRPDLRAGDADREAVVEVLRHAHAEGRLDLTEVDERMVRAYAARTFGDLDAIVADLPDVSLPWATSTGSAPAVRDAPLVLHAALSTERRTGRWAVPRRIVAEAAMSDVKLDFREAVGVPRRIEIEVKAGMGAVVLVLPVGWSVDSGALTSTWGSVKNRHRAPAAPGSPTIVVSGSTGIGTFKTRGPYFYE